MKFIEETLTTEIAGEWDVIVAGGGTAGAVAGIAAARAGAKVLVIERQLSLGGMWTGGFVNPVFDFKKKGGILAELIEDHKKLGTWGGMWNMCFSYENMKRLLESKLVEAGGEVLFQTDVSRVLTEGRKVIGIVADNRAGRKAYLAKTVIDCTGDANVAAMAGCTYDIGRPEDGLCQAMTLMFTIGNIDFHQKSASELYDMVAEALAKEDTGYRLPFQKPYIIQIPNSRTAVVQLTHMRGFDPLNPYDLSKAAIEGRKQAYEVVEFLKHHVERFRDIELLETAPLLGVRDSRRIHGEYTLTREDCGEGRHFEDEITTAAFGIDIHNPVDESQQCYPVKRYGIPYRCMIPKNTEGLLVAGRTISGTYEAVASYRVTGNCAAMGEAAGIAAAIRTKKDCSVRDVDVKEILSYIIPQENVGGIS